MRYWLTTHWPHRKDKAGPNAPHSGVFLNNEHQAAAEGMEVGDLVLIYEIGTAPDVQETLPNGQVLRKPHHQGKRGIVAVVEVVATPAARPGVSRQRYADGKSRDWSFKAITRDVETGGFLSRDFVLRVLRYRDTYRMRGYGKLHSGLGELHYGEFTQLRNAYAQSIGSASLATSAA